MNNSDRPPLRILAIATNYSPTLFIHLLRPLRDDARFTIQVITQDILTRLAQMPTPEEMTDGVAGVLLDKARPDLVFASRYNGPLATELVRACRRRNIPYIFHLDDNLMEVSPDQGADKVAYYQHPQRLQALQIQMEEASLSYFSTAALRDRMLALGLAIRSAYVGPICAAVDPLPEPAPRPAGAPPVFGYAASAGHVADLRLALPGILAALDRFPEARFELIGSIDSVPELAAYGERVRHERKFATYDEYLLDLNRRAWDLALAPLCDTPFTRMKTYTKWVEYAAAGIPAIVSDHPIYRECCADGAALLVKDGDWAEALPALLGDAPQRQAIAARAQQRVAERYTLDRLREQLLEALRAAGVRVY